MPSHAASTPAPILPPINQADLHHDARDLFTQGVAWLEGHWFQILIATAIGAGIYLALRAARHLGEHLRERDESGTGWPAIFGRAVAATNSVFMVALAARLVEHYAHAPTEIAETVHFLFTVAAVFQAAVWARELILGTVERRTAGENAGLATAVGLIRVLVNFALFAVALVVVLDNIGVNVTGLVAGLGVGGIAIGLAAQSTFADLFAALAIIFDRPFRRGDTIAYDQSVGTVEAIGIKTTRLRAPGGEERIISNKHLLDKEIQNVSRREYRRVSFTLAVARATPVERLRAIPAMLEAVVRAAGQSFVHAGFVGFGASSFDFQLEFDSLTPDYDAFYRARHEVALAVIERFASEGVELAYPTQTIITVASDAPEPETPVASSRPKQPDGDGS